VDLTSIVTRDHLHGVIVEATKNLDREEGVGDAYQPLQRGSRPNSAFRYIFSKHTISRMIIGHATLHRRPSTQSARCNFAHMQEYQAKTLGVSGVV
jgi:hypothetical protein